MDFLVTIRAVHAGFEGLVTGFEDREPADWTIEASKVAVGHRGDTPLACPHTPLIGVGVQIAAAFDIKSVTHDAIGVGLSRNGSEWGI